MNYNKQNFIKGQILKADHLNAIEDGIVSNSEELNQLKDDLVALDDNVYKLNADIYKTKSYETIDVDLIIGEGASNTGEILSWTNCVRTVLYPVKHGEKYKITGRTLHQYVAVAFYNSSTEASQETFVSYYGTDGNHFDEEIEIPESVNGMIVSMAQYSTYGNPVIKKEVFSESKIVDIETRLDNVETELFILDSFEVKQLERRISNAEKGNDFAWATFDKPYFVFIQDDLNSTIADYVSVFNAKNVPICEAIIPKRVTNENIEVLRSVVSNGGEILAHYTGSITDESTDDEWLTYTRDIKKEIESYGFDVRGIVRAGNTAYKSNKGEKYCRKYFDYANDGMGISTQYDLPRIGIWNFNTIDDLKNRIDWQANTNGIHAYGFHGVSPDRAWVTPQALGEVIDYIKGKGCEIVTYSYLFDTFGSSVLEQRLLALENKLSN